MNYDEEDYILDSIEQKTIYSVLYMTQINKLIF